MKREETLEEKCKHLHSKEVQLLKKINQVNCLVSVLLYIPSY